MELLTEPEIDLFGKDLPSMDEIKKLSEFVHSSESNLLNFSEQLEENIGKGGQKASLATGVGLFLTSVRSIPPPFSSILTHNNRLHPPMMRASSCWYCWFCSGFSQTV